MLRLPDVSVYEARNNYWVGEIIKNISGGDSLYLDYQKKWGFMIETKDNKPHSVHFDNGKVWSFCGQKNNSEWSRLLEDWHSGNPVHARVHRIFTDSMHLSLSSKNAILTDLLIWSI
jgi:hypothetical protein